MILDVQHKKLQVYCLSQQIVRECYLLVHLLPSSEKFNLASQISRAAVSVVLNIAEGASRKSANERKRFYEVARGSLIEIDSAIDLCIMLKFIQQADVALLSPLMNSSFKMLSRMIITLAGTIKKE